MSDFRRTMEDKGKLLKNRFSFQHLQFNRSSVKNELISAWKDYIGNTPNNLSVRADLTFKRNRKMFLPSIGSHPQTSIIHKITEGDAIVNIGSFLNRLNYASYKHAYKRYGKELSVISCIEGGRKSLRENTPNRDADKELHCHLLLEKPDHIKYEDFEFLIIKLWLKTEWGNTQNYIKPIRNLFASAKYNVKSSLDSLDLINTHLNTKV